MYVVSIQKQYTLSAPIIWDKKNNKGKVKALVVNSGNANAHTGNHGLKIIDNYVNKLSKNIQGKKNEILVSSTGVIGEKFNPSLITNKFKILKPKNKNSILESAKAIMTTDTKKGGINQIILI
jgi:N-acetylglutamate synthase (N-acetylornithine aminotransferase)